MCFSKLLITILIFIASNQEKFYSFVSNPHPLLLPLTLFNNTLHLLSDCLIGHVPPDQGIAQVIRVSQIYATGLVQE